MNINKEEIDKSLTTINDMVYFYKSNAKEIYKIIEVVKSNHEFFNGKGGDNVLKLLINKLEKLTEEYKISKNEANNTENRKLRFIKDIRCYIKGWTNIFLNGKKVGYINERDVGCDVTLWTHHDKLDLSGTYLTKELAINVIKKFYEGQYDKTLMEE